MNLGGILAILCTLILSYMLIKFAIDTKNVFRLEQ